MKTPCSEFLAKVREIIARIEEEERGNIEKGAEFLARSIREGGLIHVFGTGHSHIFAEEAFFRAGGLACINPMLEPSLMLHTGAVKSSILEDRGGIAEVIFEHFGPKPPDSLVLFSNSGVNSVPVEMAMLAKKRGISVIGVGSKRYIEYLKKEKNRESIMEYCDVFIDNKGEIGDACVELGGSMQRIGPTSTIAGALILHLLVIETALRLAEEGFPPPIFVSGNLPGGKEANRKLIEQYRQFIRML
ncbi:sugar isomerase domain-containing protein [Candidatus Caldatribacterium saccharofermentans]|uniref:sugar isomerase domain-containing protein n=1 Tax=Candidatus Caldatribacterium saccharofermentans TaxID=1454753 RepID=UPI003D038D24